MIPNSQRIDCGPLSIEMGSGTKRMRALIAHCWTGTPDSAWYPALACRMRELGFDVTVPALPDTDDPDPIAWQRALQDAVAPDAGALVVVGHSLGALALLRWLLAAKRSIAAAVLVAPPIGPSALPEINRFRVTHEDVHAALAWVGRTIVVVSDQDPYLLPTPAAVAEVFEAAGAERLLIPGRGHFSPKSGLKRLPEIEPLLASMMTRDPGLTG